MLALLVRRLDHRQAQAADIVAEQRERALDGDRVRRDPQQLDRGAQLCVERSCAFDIARSEPAQKLAHLRPDDVRVHAHAATSPKLEERQDQVVVSGVEIEAELDDRARLRKIRVRLLHGAHRRNLSQRRDRVGLEIEDDARRDVVDDDWLVGCGCNRPEVRDDAARRRLVVVRRHNEDAIHSELVRALREVHRVRGRVRAGAGDDGRAISDLVERRLVESHALVVAERRRLTRRPRHHEAVRAVVDEVSREGPERLQVNTAVGLERRDYRGQYLAEHNAVILEPRRSTWER